MAAGSYDIFAERGESFSLEFEYLDVNMNSIDLSDYIIQFKVKSTSTTTDEYIFEVYSELGITVEGTLDILSTDKTEYGSIEILDDTDSVGKFVVKIDSETMQALKRGYYFYNIRLIGDDNSITSILKGRFVVQSEVD
jgi:hypothetical protein